MRIHKGFRVSGKQLCREAIQDYSLKLDELALVQEQEKLMWRIYRLEDFYFPNWSMPVEGDLKDDFYVPSDVFPEEESVSQDNNISDGTFSRFMRPPRS